VASRSLYQLTQLATQLVTTLEDQLKSTRYAAEMREQRMYNDIAEREHRLLADAADREHRLLLDTAERDRRARELEAQREQRLLDDVRQARELDAQREQSARDALLADVQLQRDREAQREIDMRRDLYDLSRQSARAAALEAELKCVKANLAPPTVAYEIVDVQSADIAPPIVNTAVQVPPSRPVTPTSIEYRPNIADTLTWNRSVADTTLVYSRHDVGISTLEPPYLSSESTICRTDLQYTQPQLSDRGYTPPHQSDTLSRRPITTAANLVLPQYQSDTQPRTPAATDITDHASTRTFSRSMPQSAGTQSMLTSALLRPSTLVRPPPRDNVVTSALPRLPTVPGDSADRADGRNMVTSVLPRPPAAPGEFAYDTMQRPADRVYTHSIEQLLADLPTPPPVHRQPAVPLRSDRTQTTASEYVNMDSITSPLYVNTMPYSSAPLSTAFGQPNVTQPSALHAASYTSDLHSSGLVAFNPAVCTSYTDNSRHLHIAVGQPELSAFSRVDAPQKRPIAVDPTVHYTVCTSATADHVRPTVIVHTPQVPSPFPHWRKRLAYDYVQPDTGLGASTHAAPVVHSGYIGPQTSDTHTHKLVWTCKTCHLEKVI